MSNIQNKNYSLEIIGAHNLFEEDLRLIEEYAKRFMEKISKLSGYDYLRITFKTIGNTIGTHLRQINIKLLISREKQNVLRLEKAISPGTSDELTNNKNKTNWNTPLLFQETLKALETMVKSEMRKA